MALKCCFKTRLAVILDAMRGDFTEKAKTLHSSIADTPKPHSALSLIVLNIYCNVQNKDHFVFNK